MRNNVGELDQCGEDFFLDRGINVPIYGLKNMDDEAKFPEYFVDLARTDSASQTVLALWQGIFMSGSASERETSW